MITSGRGISAGTQAGMAGMSRAGSSWGWPSARRASCSLCSLGMWAMFHLPDSRSSLNASHSCNTQQRLFSTDSDKSYSHVIRVTQEPNPAYESATGCFALQAWGLPLLHSCPGQGCHAQNAASSPSQCCTVSLVTKPARTCASDSLPPARQPLTEFTHHTTLKVQSCSRC